MVSVVEYLRNKVRTYHFTPLSADEVEVVRKSLAEASHNNDIEGLLPASEVDEIHAMLLEERAPEDIWTEIGREYADILNGFIPITG